MKPMTYLVLLLVLAGLSGCGDDPVLPNSYLTPQALPTGNLVLKSADAGVFPDRSVLDDPDNPFSHCPITEQLKWRDQGGVEGGYGSGLSKARFYLWSTLLIREPWGEPQYYTALALLEQWELNSSTVLSNQAVRAYRALLENFFRDLAVTPSGTLERIALWAAYDLKIRMGINLADWGYIYESAHNILEKQP